MPRTTTSFTPKILKDLARQTARFHGHRMSWFAGERATCRRCGAVAVVREDGSTETSATDRKCRPASPASRN